MTYLSFRNVKHLLVSCSPVRGFAGFLSLKSLQIEYIFLFVLLISSNDRSDNDFRKVKKIVPVLRNGNVNFRESTLSPFVSKLLEDKGWEEDDQTCRELLDAACEGSERGAVYSLIAPLKLFYIVRNLHVFYLDVHSAGSLGDDGQSVCELQAVLSILSQLLGFVIHLFSSLVSARGKQRCLSLLEIYCNAFLQI